MLGSPLLHVLAVFCQVHTVLIINNGGKFGPTKFKI